MVLDIGSLMGSLVGSTEANIRQALRIADAMSPRILFCDEVEKALSGMANSGQTDSGVSARLFASLTEVCQLSDALAGPVLNATQVRSRAARMRLTHESGERANRHSQIRITIQPRWRKMRAFRTSR